MNLRDYFENTKGVGVLATADADGKDEVAVHSGARMIMERFQEALDSGILICTRGETCAHGARASR